MRLTDLDPRWVGAGGDGITRDGKPVPERRGVGVSFICPCKPGGCETRVFVEFDLALNGGPPHDGRVTWHREGDTFETLTLTPSIQRVGGCGWHGFITNGDVHP